MKTPSCRLCGAETLHRFNAMILSKYEAGFFECKSCRSLESEAPYWLDEAYRSSLSFLDTGAVQRNINNFAFVLTLCRLLGVTTTLDFGGSDGLLCRFLRDHQIDAYLFDRYSAPKYAQGFARRPEKQVELLTAFEVLEHMPNPSADLNELFDFRAPLVLCSTELYTGQNQDWWYLAKEGGQHVFFYSPQSLALIAHKYNYSVARVGPHILFFRQDIPNIHQLLFTANTMLSGWVFQAIKSYVFLLPAPGSERDMQVLKTRQTALISEENGTPESPR